MGSVLLGKMATALAVVAPLLMTETKAVAGWDICTERLAGRMAATRNAQGGNATPSKAMASRRFTVGPSVTMLPVRLSTLISDAVGVSSLLSSRAATRSPAELN